MIPRLKICFVIATTALVAASIREAHPQARKDILSTPEQIQLDIAQVPCAKDHRLEAVQALFQKMGATMDEMTTQKSGRTVNLIVKRSAAARETVIIGAHYDFARPGCGAIDNWSGIVVMAHIYKTIGQSETKKNLQFVAFDREEDGLIGSRAMVSTFAKDEVPQYCAMINIDSFGLAVPFALENRSSGPLVDLSEELAESLKIPFYRGSIENADADSSSFISKKIPAITLSGLSRDWATILHTRKDQVNRVNAASVYLGYRLALSLWSRIDEASCNAFKDAL